MDGSATVILKERLALKSSDVADAASVNTVVEKTNPRDPANAGADDSEDVKETVFTEFKEREHARAHDREIEVVRTATRKNSSRSRCREAFGKTEFDRLFGLCRHQPEDMLFLCPRK